MRVEDEGFRGSQPEHTNPDTLILPTASLNWPEPPTKSVARTSFRAAR